MKKSASAEQLISEHFELQDRIKSASKVLADHIAPWKARLDEIDGVLLAILNEQKSKDSSKSSMSTDAGTAYLSHLMNVSVDTDAAPYINAGGESQTGRMALLDFALENWENIGADLLLVQPQKDAVKRYMEEHDGLPPPGLKIGWFTRVNVRRS
jgi:hypothetical protein